ncbi:hypothetical protein AB0L40_03490 [Patulibacter sp. NPDC049589]|uniref:hypothetical protein n=1 Tax=Patulibacter sp. NPDC049589 TaxID=3154731 RepID=UPI003443F6C6
MRRPPRVLALVLVVLGGLLGTSAPASASDDGLRALVTTTALTREKVEREIGAVRPPAKVTLRSYLSYLDRVARVHAKVGRTAAGLLRDFGAEPADTPQAGAGRELVLSGLDDLSKAADRYAAAARRAAKRLRRAHTTAAVRRAADAFERDGSAFRKLANRGIDRAGRGGAMIASAPTMR